jgi:hypothetical protein
MLAFELFAFSPTTPEVLWAVVGDLSRLPAWTDAERVNPPTGSVEEGATFETHQGGETLTWTVITTEPWLLEAKADTACGRVGIGVRVAPDTGGSRLVIAGMLKPSAGTVRARLVDLPRLRRRCDAWSARAVEFAVADAG